jgi:hypothetical protein
VFLHILILFIRILPTYLNPRNLIKISISILQSSMHSNLQSLPDIVSYYFRRILWPHRASYLAYTMARCSWLTPMP